MKVRHQGDSHHAKSNSYHDTHDQLGQQSFPGSSGIPGCHESLDRRLITTQRGNVPDQGHENRSKPRHSRGKRFRKNRLRLPIGWPLGRNPGEATKIPGHDRQHRQGPTVKQYRLNQVGDHDRLQTTQRRIDDCY